jgi:amino acid transporter
MDFRIVKFIITIIIFIIIIFFLHSNISRGHSSRGHSSRGSHDWCSCDNSCRFGFDVALLLVLGFILVLVQ